jgi:hypothetical protein
MRSEKEIRDKIEHYRQQRDLFQIKSNAWNTYDALVSAFQWVLHAPKEEPLSAIELKELRGIMKAWKEEAELRGIKQGYSQAGQGYVQASGGSSGISPSLGKYPFPGN